MEYTAEALRLAGFCLTYSSFFSFKIQSIFIASTECETSSAHILSRHSFDGSALNPVCNTVAGFDVLLTVHLSIILVTVELNAQILVLQ